MLVRASGRMKIAHRFIGGIVSLLIFQSVKRTAEKTHTESVLQFCKFPFLNVQSSASRTLNHFHIRFPAMNRWAIFIRALRALRYCSNARVRETDG